MDLPWLIADTTTAVLALENGWKYYESINNVRSLYFADEFSLTFQDYLSRYGLLDFSSTAQRQASKMHRLSIY